MSLIEVFDEITQIIKYDYSGHVEKKGWDKPELYRNKLLELEKNNSLNRENFYEVVQDYILDLKDKHVHLINKSETKPRMTTGFKTRRFKDKLYITEIKEETNLKKGMAILKIDDKDILELVEQNRKILRSEIPEREEWINILLKAKTCLIEDNDGNQFEFSLNQYPFENKKSDYSLTQIEHNILLLKINDFMDSNQLHSLIETNQELIEKTENLIIDIRVNGGGSDSAYQKLLKYIFLPDSSFSIDGVFQFMTKRNFKNRSVAIIDWVKTLTNQDEIDSINLFLSETKEIIDKGFIELDDSKTQTISIDGTLIPKNVVLLIDMYCGSSGDQFALMSTYSNKVKLIGRNTSGGFDYGNVAFEKFPEYDFELMYPTSKSRRVIEGRGLDNIGVKPDIYIPWTPEHLKKDIDIEAALNYLSSLKN